MSTEALAANYLFLQPMLEARLRELFAVDGIPVEGIESLAQVGDADLRPLIVYVMWAGDTFDESDAGRAGRGASQMLRQRWMVGLRVSNVAQANRDARNTSAGQLLSRIHKSIAGWAPPGLARAFVRAGSLTPSYTKASGMYPLGFGIQLTL